MLTRRNSRVEVLNYRRLAFGGGLGGKGPADPTVLRTARVTCAGIPIEFYHNRILPIDVGGVVVAGIDVGLEHLVPSIGFELEPAALAADPVDVGMEVTRSLLGEPGGVVADGVDVVLFKSYTFGLDVAALAATGVDVGFGVTRSIGLESAGVVTAGELTFDVFRELEMEAGAVSAAPVDVELSQLRVFSLDVSAIALTGVDVGLEVTRSIGLEASATTLAGVDAGLARQYGLVGEVAEVAASGVDVDLLVVKDILLEVSAIALTGVDVELDYQPGGEPVVVTYLGTEESAIATDFEIGEASADRKIVVVAAGIRDGVGALSPGCQIGGVGATLDAYQNGNDDGFGGSAHLAVFSLDVPSGTTVTIELSWGSFFYDTDLYIYSIVGAGAADDTAVAGGDASGSPVNISVDVESGGAVIAGVVSFNLSPVSHNWVGVTEDAARTVYEQDRRAVASAEVAEGATPRTVTWAASFASNNSYASAAVAYEF